MTATAKIPLATQADAVELRALNERDWLVQRRKGLHLAKDREAAERQMRAVEVWLPALEAAAQTMKWLAAHGEQKIKAALAAWED